MRTLFALLILALSYNVFANNCTHWEPIVAHINYGFVIDERTCSTGSYPAYVQTYQLVIRDSEIIDKINSSKTIIPQKYLNKNNEFIMSDYRYRKVDKKEFAKDYDYMFEKGSLTVFVDVNTYYNRVTLYFASYQASDNGPYNEYKILKKINIED